jgi:aminoglycoside 2''-phosphotransferase
MNTDQQERYLQSIQRDYPELVILEVSLNSQEGQYNDLLLINNRIIFRFPKFEAGLATLQRETFLLKQIKGRLPLAIPNPKFVSQDMKSVGRAFMGYPKIEGEPLWNPRFQSIKDQQVLEHLATQLAGFLWELHHLPLDQFEANLPLNDLLQDWQKMYEEIRTLVFPKLSPESQDAISYHFETYLNQAAAHPFEPALRHGDFGSGNILYNPQTQSISGILDFGFAGLGDPALDIAAAMTFGESFFNYYYAAYPQLDSLIERARFYKGTFALQEALYGLKHGDPKALERGIAAYKK